MQHVRVSSHQSPVHKLGDSHMTLSPKFRLAVIQSDSFLHPKLGTESNIVGGGPLIPGLPDDVAIICLLRLPIESHTACRAVCKRWHLVLGSRERFFTRRKQLGFRGPWLYIFAFHKGMEKTQCHVLDLANWAWHTIPPMPCPRACGFRSVGIANEGAVLVCGGIGGVVEDQDSPTDSVLKYDVCKNRWSVMRRMNTARSFFASGMIDGLVYVAGGNSSGLLDLDSAEVLDPVSGEGNWRPIAKMGINAAAYDAAVLNGKLLVTEGWLWPFMYSPRGQVFDPVSNTWEPMPVGLREGWTGPSVVVGDEHLFVASELEKVKLKIYDPETDSWDVVLGAPIPEQIRKPFSLSSADFRIFIVGSGLHVAVGYLRKLKLQCGTSKDWSCFVEWEVVSALEAFCELMPSSSQVLYA
ncbi:hypothetical protein Sjap_007594 [Stephania japonica]|uniref:F-box domain-containing protein n=1 Tax=Stephania japonica TaxID=461633 RepID=A0AAP0JNT0_9MAGN